jgi:hypothetical protein
MNIDCGVESAPKDLPARMRPDGDGGVEGKNKMRRD